MLPSGSEGIAVVALNRTLLGDGSSFQCADAVLEEYARPERQAAEQLELARAAATRTCCAYLVCGNLGATSKVSSGVGWAGLERAVLLSFS